MKLVERRNDKSTKIRMILASDSKFFMGGIRKILQSTGEIRILAEASEYAEIGKSLARIKPEFLFVDNRMLKLDITKLLFLKNERSPSTKIIVLDDQEVRACTALNLVYITKETNSSKLMKIIRDRRGTFIRKSNPEGARPKLTQRQLKVIELVANGFTNKEIADQFSISEKTVKAHLTSIFTKLGLQNRYQLQLMVYTKYFRSKVG